MVIAQTIWNGGKSVSVVSLAKGHYSFMDKKHYMLQQRRIQFKTPIFAEICCLLLHLSINLFLGTETLKTVEHR